MTPERLRQCLVTIHWPPETMARTLECGVSLVDAWLNGEQEIPTKVAAWIGTLAIAHQTAETGKPVSLKGKRYKPPHDA